MSDAWIEHTNDDDPLAAESWQELLEADPSAPEFMPTKTTSSKANSSPAEARVQTFHIHEETVYQVEAATAQEALKKFLGKNGISTGQDIIGCTVNERHVTDGDGEEQETADT